jgi:hypothetical protein
MDPTLQALFDENAAPTHASVEIAHTILAQVVAFATKIEHQVTRYHELRRAARFAPQDFGPRNLGPTIENLRPRIDDVGIAAKELLVAAERLSDAMLQLDRVMPEKRAAIERHYAMLTEQQKAEAAVAAAAKTFVDSEVQRPVI